MAGYRTRDPMISGQTSYRYTHMSFTPKWVRIRYFNSITLYIEADEGQVGPGTVVASTQNLTLTANLALILTPNLTLTANLT